MAWDIALDNNFDLIFAGNRDFAYVDGANLQQQRIRVRLIIERGAWVYDRAGTLGSRLRSLTGMTRPSGLAEMKALIEEALEGMDDVEIVNITIDPDEDAPRGVAANIQFRPRILADRERLQVAQEVPVFVVSTPF